MDKGHGQSSGMDLLASGMDLLDIEDIAKRIKAVSYLTGEFRLRSGQTSAFYWDKYRFESDPFLLHSIVAELEHRLPASFDKLAGLELGGVPLATGLSLKIGKAVSVCPQRGEGLRHLQSC